MPNSGKLRYYATTPPATRWSRSVAPHSEFLRTGKIARPTPPAASSERRYLTPQEVAERTDRILAAAGLTTHTRLNSVHQAIQFPKVIFSRVFEDIPHLGYCHVTTASTSFDARARINWSFYIANFASEISETYPFFEHIRSGSGRMYFAVAFEKAPGDTFRIDRSLRKNGLLFRTGDAQEAMKNVLLLGAPNAAVRAEVKKL
ncbi:MAG: DUF6656 family protein [Pseudorhizobium sp.]